MIYFRNRTKKLVFRAKLTMHTAFERPDNVDPAAVTALAISKDHKSVYVGDDKGRVFVWSVSSRPGKGPFPVFVDPVVWPSLNHLNLNLNFSMK